MQKGQAEDNKNVAECAALKVQNATNFKAASTANLSSDDIVAEVLKSNSDDNIEELLQNVFIPNWNNKPADVKPILRLAGVPFLTHQNTSSIIAQPGMGKTSLCEATVASFLNPNADCLGFEVDTECEGVLLIDNERTNIDVWNSFNRTCQRAGMQHGKKIDNVTFAGLRSVPRLDERIKVIEKLLSNHPCSLLIIDGAGDLVTDPNDLLQAIECRIWLREVTVKHNVSILTTLHPNPGSLKPRGHIGSEVLRESEGVLVAKNAENGLRVLTTDFEHGKNRNNDHATSAYRWDDEYKMFVTADLDQVITAPNRSRARKTKAELLVMKLLPPPVSMRNTDLIKAIMDNEEVAESTAKRLIKDMIYFEFIKKHEDGLYRKTV